MALVTQPPTIGDLLPRVDEAHGIEAKITAYCLNLDHEVGGPKAQGILRILGIGLEDADHLARAARRPPRRPRL